MTSIFTDMQQELELFFDDLNWTYIMMYLIVMYGIKHKQEFLWYNYLFEKAGSIMASLKTWIAGIIIGIAFCFFTEAFSSQWLSQLLRSWLVVIVFNSMLTNSKIKGDSDI
jgi:magnesium-transporting ATPase (P-type)